MSLVVAVAPVDENVPINEIKKERPCLKCGIPSLKTVGEFFLQFWRFFFFQRGRCYLWLCWPASSSTLESLWCSIFRYNHGKTKHLDNVLCGVCICVHYGLFILYKNPSKICPTVFLKDVERSERHFKDCMPGPVLLLLCTQMTIWSSFFNGLGFIKK